MKDLLDERLKYLGITKYEVAKRVAKVRGKKVGDVTSSVANVLSGPERRRFDNLAEVIRALDGEIVVRWHTTEENVVS
ncbi:MAG: hypothetical protein AAFZ17_01395 [Cyanobacteria bacterium J06650_10]